MASSPFLVGTAIVAGGAALYALYKAWQAKQQTAAQNFCSGACGDNDTTCQAACNVAADAGQAVLNVLGEISPFSDSEGAWKTQFAADQASNDKLNGPVALYAAQGDIAGPDPTSPLVGNVLMYQNGCMPYFDAPGWPNCAKGTVDMYVSAEVQRAGGGDYSANSASEAALVTNAGLPQPANAGYVEDGTLDVYKINKNNFLTGKLGDPTTKGPFGPAGSGLEMYIIDAYDGNPDPDVHNAVDVHNLLFQFSGDRCSKKPDGSDYCPDESKLGPLTWYARGTRITCPAGQVPKSVLLGVNGETNPDPIGTEVCVSAIGGANLCNGTQAPPGFTWDSTNGVWVRATSGQAINNGPCDPNFNSCIGAACVNQNRAGGGLQTTGGGASSAAASSTRSASASASSSLLGTTTTLGAHLAGGILGGFL